ncbi:MAG TPA: pitrilysin family protein [Polyangiaceae bacterium]|nr:pitrilysin family protein [Polyangiaceae bacterium]
MSTPNEEAGTVTRPITEAGSASQPIVEADRAVPLVHVSIASKVGSLLDPIGKEGAARMLMRLMRRSGAGRSAEQADELVDRIGGHLGAEVTRSTAGFHGGVIARSQAAFLDFTFESLCQPRFAPGEFEQLRQESLAECTERLDDDRARARHFWLRKLFSGHPYGRPSGGTPESLRRVELSDLEELRERLFTRQHMRFAFAGAVDEPMAREAAARFHEALPVGREVAVDPADPVTPNGRTLVFVDKPERTQTQIVIGCLGTHAHDEDHTALHVGNTVFGGTFTSRLMQEVRAKRGWSYGTSSAVPFDRRRQAFSMWAFPQASDAAPCLELELQLLERWVKDGITARELAAAKKYLTRSHAFAVDTAQKRAALRLDESIYALPPGYQGSYLERVAAVTLEQVNEAIRRRITPEHLVITVLGTHAEIGARIEAAIPRLASAETVRFDAD